jgi:hypothetical protein
MTSVRLKCLYKLVTYNTLMWQLSFWSQGLYSQHFIFFVTYLWAKLARVLQYTWL